MAFSNPLDSITVPAGATTGIRIDVGSELPPPLDTYLVDGSIPYNNGIIFYSATPTNDDYLYLAQIQYPGTHQLHFGAVIDGAVSEIAPGVPRAVKMGFDGGGNFFSEYVGTYFRFGQTLDPDSFEPDPIILPNDFALQWGVVGGGYTTTGSITTGGAETAMTTAAWTEEPVFLAVPGHVYRFRWKANIFVSGATIALALGTTRLRIGQQSTSGTIVCVTYVQAQTNFATYTVEGWAEGRFTGTDPVNRYVSLTLQRNAGTGTNLNLGSDANAPIVVEVEDLGLYAYTTPYWDNLLVQFS